MFVVDTWTLKDKRLVLYDDLGTLPNSGLVIAGVLLPLKIET